jgi:mRNA interferase MazF
VKRGEVYDVRLDPIEGSEQAGYRPAVIVSRDAINAASTVILAVPCTTYRPGRRIYPSQVLLRAPEGGLDVDSVALGEQVRALSAGRFGRRRGALSAAAMAQLDRALLIAMDLPGQFA